MGRRRLLLPILLAAALAAGQGRSAPVSPDAEALAEAKREAGEATLRSLRLERQAAEATDEAVRARAAAEAVAARIQAAEADITAAETRVRIIEAERAAQRARLAERQQPLARLTAALQTMARRPPALALVQPGSVEDAIHVRALLASTLPVIRARTAALREEVEAGNALRRRAGIAVAALQKSRAELRRQRIALARLEARERHRSRSLADSALVESDRALALGEEARDLAARMDRADYQRRIRASLAALPGPLPRPTAPAPPRVGARRYSLPVEGRVVTGMGELSEGGVHARGITLETRAGAEVTAPRAGRIAYAGRFRGYGEIVILDHGGGWTTTITNLASLSVRVGDSVHMGAAIGRAGAGTPRIAVELRRQGRPVAIAPLLAS